MLRPTKLLFVAPQLVSAYSSWHKSPQQPLAHNTEPQVPCDTTYMTQWIDHSNHSAGTFQQQVQVVTKFFRPGGPILFFQGEESVEMTCIESTSFYRFAEELGGIAASIEHRYFGKSAPFGSDSYTRDNFRYLTLDHVMDDSVKFVRQIRANVSGADNSPAIVGSGSYGALLTAALRLNRPDDIYGALSAAPPVMGFYRGHEDVPTRFDWLDWVSNVIADRSNAAAQAIKKAFARLNEAIKAGETAALQHDLGLCREPNRPGDDELLILALTNVFSLSAEFNYPYASRGRTPIANPLDKLVNTVLAKKEDAFAMLRAATLQWNEALNLSRSCIDFEESMESSVPLIQWTPFKYIVCTFVPLMTSARSQDALFIPYDPPASEFTSYCNEEYGVTPLIEDDLIQRYRLSQNHFERSERIIFSVGQYDPVTVMAPRQFRVTANRNASKILYVSNMGHREELLAAHPDDKPEVIAARAVELETFKGWLGYDS